MAVSAAMGAREAMTSAMARARAGRSPGAVTSVTSPHPLAVAASTGSPVRIIIAAFEAPIEWDRPAAMPPPPIQPSLISGAANLALVEAMRMSQLIAVSSPPPKA
ncbi:hypothetical protein D3C87_1613560 [compost metagenome]